MITPPRGRCLPQLHARSVPGADRRNPPPCNRQRRSAGRPLRPHLEASDNSDERSASMDTGRRTPRVRSLGSARAGASLSAKGPRLSGSETEAAVITTAAPVGHKPASRARRYSRSRERPPGTPRIGDAHLTEGRTGWREPPHPLNTVVDKQSDAGRRDHPLITGNGVRAERPSGRPSQRGHLPGSRVRPVRLGLAQSEE